MRKFMPDADREVLEAKLKEALDDGYVWESKDLQKVRFDHKNWGHEAMGTEVINDQIFRYQEMWAGGDWEYKVYLYAYLDHKNKLRFYVPKEGNPYNHLTKEAFGNADDDWELLIGRVDRTDKFRGNKDVEYLSKKLGIEFSYTEDNGWACVVNRKEHVVEDFFDLPELDSREKRLGEIRNHFTSDPIVTLQKSEKVAKEKMCIYGGFKYVPGEPKWIRVVSTSRNSLDSFIEKQEDCYLWGIKELGDCEEFDYEGK